MPNPENVIGKGNRFKKGQSGNPKGGPKKLPDLNQVLAEVLGIDETGKDGTTRIIQRLRKMAEDGNARAAELLLNRAYGMPKQTVEQVGQISVTMKIEEAGGELNTDD